MNEGHRPAAALRPAIAAVAVLSLFAVAAVALLAGRPDMPFYKYFGGLPPVLATVIIIVLAAAAHLYLHAGGSFAVICLQRLARGLAIAVVAGSVLAVPTVLADIALRFPQDINAPLPGALLFYPLMGYVAETAFHLVPLSVLLLAARLVTRRDSQTVVWPVIAIVALVEPMFQVMATFGRSGLSALDIFVLVHLTVFSLALLALYRRYDFVTAFAFRLAYYLVWHILWGWARLPLVF